MQPDALHSGATIAPEPDGGHAHSSIGDLCSEFAVTARALRFYEDEGLITPTRRGSARCYSQRDRARLAWILRGKRVGFSLAEIREMIDLYDIGDGRKVQRAVTIARCRERIAQLSAQRCDIDLSIAELESFVGLVERGRTVDHGMTTAPSFSVPVETAAARSS